MIPFSIRETGNVLRPFSLGNHSCISLTSRIIFIQGETTQQIRWPEQEPKEAIEMEKHQSKMEKQDEDD